MTYNHAQSRIWLGLLSLLLAVPQLASAQGTDNAVEFKVKQPNSRLEMVVSTSRILTLERDVPRALVNNTDIVSVYPLSSTQVQLSAKKAGVTTVNLWDDEGNLHTVDVVVIGDARELEMLLKQEFPQASLRVRPLSSSVILTGRVDQAEIVSRIVRMAEDYYPKVINNISVGGVQQVLLQVKVMEVSRSKLRKLGIDWTNIGNTDVISQSVSGLIGAVNSGARTVTTSGGETLSLGLFSEGNAFFLVLEALAENSLAKILAEPTLVTVSGRPASFNAGGEFPILVPQSLGTVGVEFKEFGTRVDFVPIVLGNGHIRLEVRPQVSELDRANGVNLNNEIIPALRTRWVDTAVEMKAGQTLALAGLIQTRVEAQRRQLPLLGDLPWVGAAFRRVDETQNEIELVVTVRPELVDALEPHEVPACGPGARTTSPSDSELYGRGYMEVPNCCPDGSCSRCQSGSSVVPNNTYEIPSEPAADYPQSYEQLPSESSDYSVPLQGKRSDGAAPANTRISSRPQRTQVPVGRRAMKTAIPTGNPKGQGFFGPDGRDVLDYKE